METNQTSSQELREEVRNLIENGGILYAQMIDGVNWVDENYVFALIDYFKDRIESEKAKAYAEGYQKGKSEK